MGCNLCEKEGPLVKGHIVPKFISKYSKLQVNSKRFRNVVADVNKSFQDIDQLPLFCADCDNKYSIYESYFSKTLFNKTGIIDFNPDYLNKFITFTNYKILLSAMEHYKDKSNFDDLDKLRIYLKEILNSGAIDVKLRHYVIFLDNYEKLKLELINSDFTAQLLSANDEIIKDFLIYGELFNRQYKVYFYNPGSIGWHVYFIFGVIYIYFKIPGLLIITTNIDELFGINTKIDDKKRIDSGSQILYYNNFWSVHFRDIRMAAHNINENLSDDEFRRIELREFKKELSEEERKNILKEKYGI